MSASPSVISGNDQQTLPPLPTYADITTTLTASVGRAALQELGPMQPAESPCLSSKIIKQENLELAQSLLEFVIEKVPISPNYLERTPIDYKKEKLTMEDFHNLVNIYYEAANQEHAYEVFTNKEIRAIAKTALTIQIGTCLEMSAVGYDQAVETGFSDRVEIFFIDGEKGNHVFLVIGRDQSSKAEDYKNWGPNTFICDPWKNTCYNASELEANLMSYDSESLIDGRIRTNFTPFDPASQKLSLLSDYR